MDRGASEALRSAVDGAAEERAATRGRRQERACRLGVVQLRRARRCRCAALRRDRRRASVRSDGDSLDDRDATGAATFEEVMATTPPPPDTLLTSLAVRQFEYGELWNRGGITRKDRRLVTIA